MLYTESHITAGPCMVVTI